MNEALTPVLKWAGGKRRLLPILTEYVPEKYGTYFEPFLGAGALLLALQPKKAVVGDVNVSLIEMYEVIRDEVDTLIGHLSEHASVHSTSHYNEVRSLDRESTFHETTTRAFRAARLIYLNRTCFNGLHRVNSKGEFNAPIGLYTNPLILDEPSLRALSLYLKGNKVSLICGDFTSILASAKKGDFVYLDPPYHPTKDQSFTNYSQGGFTEQDQIRLKEYCDELSKRGVKWLLSNSDTVFIRRLYEAKNHQIRTIFAKRTISASTVGRGEVSELLICNW